ncbi:hypothetical protein RJ640_019538, partial [Escallonia rubra]
WEAPKYKVKVIWTMGILKREKSNPSSSSTSPCAHLRTAYHNCFNRECKNGYPFIFSLCGLYTMYRWYAEKFVKGQWDKEECVSEWQKYRDCLAQHLDDKHLSRFLEAEGIVNLFNQADSRSSAGVSK